MCGFHRGWIWKRLHIRAIRVCRFSGEGKALGGVATFAGVGFGIVASLASFNSFDVHLMF